MDGTTSLGCKTTRHSINVDETPLSLGGIPCIGPESGRRAKGESVNRSRVWRAVCIVAAGGVATACGDNGAAPAVTVTRVTIAPAIDTLWFVGDTLRVNATPQQASGAAVSRSTISWTSDDPSIVAVDQHGL